MSSQTTLLTAHKGVDLHAATALRVMQERLDGGDALRALYRCELHAFRPDAGGPAIDDVLASGRYYNPNKHHYGCFEGPQLPGWFDPEGPAADAALPAQWPGEVRGSDLETTGDELYDLLLGGRAPDGCSACDVLALNRGQMRPVISGVLWRLVLQADAEAAAELGLRLAVARGRKQGLLINPHMEAWLTAVR